GRSGNLLSGSQLSAESVKSRSRVSGQNCTRQECLPDRRRSRLAREHFAQRSGTDAPNKEHLVKGEDAHLQFAFRGWLRARNRDLPFAVRPESAAPSYSFQESRPTEQMCSKEIAETLLSCGGHSSGALQK